MRTFEQACEIIIPAFDDDTDAAVKRIINACKRHLKGRGESTEAAEEYLNRTAHTLASLGDFPCEFEEKQHLFASAIRSVFLLGLLVGIEMEHTP